MPLSHERLIAALLDRTELLRDVVRSADPATPVPTCPGWTVGALVRHLSGGQRWAADLVAARADAPPDDAFFRNVTRPAEQPPAELDRALAESSAALARALREAGPDAPVWTPFGPGAASFFTRRFTHETVVHGADAALAAGRPWTVDPELAVDGLDEWLELASVPQMLELFPERRALLGPGRTVHLHATDTPASLDAEWVVDLTGAVPSWRRAHEKSAVAVRGPVAGLLLVVCGRQRIDDAGAEVFGDRALLDGWLAASTFG
ncbi:maleylpyruvate isomerase family mycothiol-dependent enzyme [Trujillonella endophytica]|uniref:TIGR03086 family protein n=1 Tax=Trujillonella endophytica TaxID=673521 RepID=A0A1H8T2N0_9ACTN|nr:maleylpyruvate isomerase family mycothiol-dependent enzyme [Trujillella endophytica]SEO85250.1 TIGR03086 family protein [Trujillella endophytica]